MSMTVGPAMEVGGNVVEMRTDGKVQVTNPKGKVKTLTQDEFKKQTVKNADKIAAGEDFEYKKDRKGLKIAGAAIGTVAISLGIIYRKEIGKYLKNFSFKKLWQDIKNLFKSKKASKTPDYKKHNLYNGEMSSNATSPDLSARFEAKKWQQAKNRLAAEQGNELAYDFEMGLAHSKRNHSQIQRELNQALGLRKGQKDTVKITPRASLNADGTERFPVDPKYKEQWEKFHPAK